MDEEDGEQPTRRSVDAVGRDISFARSLGRRRRVERLWSEPLYGPPQHTNKRLAAPSDSQTWVLVTAPAKLSRTEARAFLH